MTVNAATSVIPHADRSGFAIHHQNRDGSQLVVTQKHLANGASHVIGYKQIDDPKRGTTTRIYSDGHRFASGRDFQSRSAYGGPTYTTYRSGLRAAALPDGRPVFREGFTMMRGLDGRERQVVQRTVYAHWVGGSPVYYTTPVVRVYDVASFYGESVYVYRPIWYEPVYYRTFWMPFAVAVPVTAVCVICPVPWVAFAAPVPQYVNPLDLVGDLQISTAFEDGAPSAPLAGGDPNNADVALADMRSEMSDLQRQVSTSLDTDSSLKARFAEQGAQMRDLQLQVDSLKAQQATNNIVPVQVPEEVRQEIRQQVRLSIAQHLNGHPLILSDVIDSGYAKIYIFQVAAPLNVREANSGDDCWLNTGDLIGFSTIPTASSPMAQMKVITSGARSCRPTQVVDVSPIDLQDMLNGFSERLEDNLQRVNSCVAAPAGCART